MSSMPVRTWREANIEEGDGYVSYSVYRPALGLAFWLGCIPRSRWADPSADNSGCHFLNPPYHAGPKKPGLEQSLEF
jgi:hypothetical protein